MNPAERLHLPGTRTGLLAVTFLALLLSPISKASAQDTRSYLEQRGFQQYSEPESNEQRIERGDIYSFLARSNDRTQPALLGEPVSENSPDTDAQSTDAGDTTEVIVVTAQRQEDFSSTVNSEFDENIFERMGIVTTENPDLEGLAFLTPEERRDNGWAISVPVFGSRRGDTGPFVSFEGGRDRIIAGGIRF